MLSDREREVLAEIERELIEGDPDFAQVMDTMNQPPWWQAWRRHTDRQDGRA